VTEYTADKFIIATGERPRYPDIPGAKEYGITRYKYTLTTNRVMYLLQTNLSFLNRAEYLDPRLDFIII